MSGKTQPLRPPSLSTLPELKQPLTASQQAGDKLAHDMLTRRLDKYALRPVSVTDDATNLLHAFRQCNHGLKPMSIAEWKHLLCDLIGAAGDSDLSPLLSQWRRVGDFDHRCLP